MKAAKRASLGEAWAIFWDEIRPGIWADLTYGERNRLIQADRAARGLQNHPLGETRARRIFDQYAPGRFEVQTEIVVWINE